MTSESLKILDIDPYLRPYAEKLEERVRDIAEKRRELVGDGSLLDFANGHRYFGLQREGDKKVFREWAPGADSISVIGDFNGWNPAKHPMTKLDNGVFEIRFPENECPRHGDHYKLLVTRGNESFERIPSYANYVVQDPNSYIWSAMVYEPDEAFHWSEFRAPEGAPIIYECHIGMATEEYRVGTYTEFRDRVLPRIAALGYNTIQIMAVMEHPYYASFGYQVSNFFAASSRYGTPDDLRSLVNRAHEMGIQVLLDVVHSHAVGNESEGLNRFDGTTYQYFHEGPKGDHPAWGTKLFNYGKNEVLHFLLSNLKFWMDEYHFDGFRFDGVTSMLYLDHGLGTAFTHYDLYFSENTDREAVTYLALANELIHAVSRDAITIAEDMSGMPGMCLPVSDGGIGFDYRLSMGMPDLFIKLLKEVRDEDWSMGQLYYELTGHRPKEKVIGYVESHDQALVGDKTVMFRLCDREMYTGMNKATRDNEIVNRGIALHKMLRLLTFMLSGDGYLNFMGNEFGHPEWIDFPREGNGWSHHYARRQWSLADDGNLRYGELRAFDQAMIAAGKAHDVFAATPKNLWTHEEDNILAVSRNDLTIVFNFHPTKSFTGYFIPVTKQGTYKVLLSTDDEAFGGYTRVNHETDYPSTCLSDGRFGILTYLPARTATVFVRTDK